MLAVVEMIVPEGTTLVVSVDVFEEYNVCMR